jgi:hypothetical protein
MEAAKRASAEIRRVICLMRRGDEECGIPPMGDPKAQAALEWVLDVIEHEEAKDDDDTI